MMIEDFLVTCSDHLKEEGLDCAIFDGDDNNPKPRLLVYLGNDEQGRERVMEIIADEQLLPTGLKDLEHAQVRSGIYRLQIQSNLPFEFQPQCAADIASTINYVNGMLELPGFWSDELNRRVFYRNVQLLGGGGFDKNILLGIVGMHQMVLELFGVLLEKVGSGETTYFAVLEDIVRYASQPNA